MRRKVPASQRFVDTVLTACLRNSYISWGFEVNDESLVKGYYEAEESGDRLVIVRKKGATGPPKETSRL